MGSLLGHNLYLCMAEKEGYALLTNREEIMNDLASNFEREQYGEALFFIRYHWAGMATAVLSLLQYAANLELLPEYGIRDFQTKLFPMLEAMRYDGWAEITGVAEETGMWVRGSLCAGN